MSNYIITCIFSFVVGAVVGSFLNVVIYRLPNSKSVVRPGSACPECKTPIAWYDNIPIISWLLLGAKCRKCKTPISIQYPLVELVTGTMALAMFMKFGYRIDTVAYFLFAAILIASTFIDLPYQIIPDELSLGGLVLGLAFSPFVLEVTVRESFLGAAFGFFIIAGIIFAYYIIRREEGMGLGDAKLLAMIGAFLGWKSILFVLVAASIQGLVVAIISFQVGWMKKAPPLPDPDEIEGDGPVESEEEVSLSKAAIPFGPFLALAALEWLFFKVQVAETYMEFVRGSMF